MRGELASEGVRLLLLDGQQRITSLYGVIRGDALAFFEGDSSAFTGLYFNIEDETFEFYAPSKMRDDERWINVTTLFTGGLEPYITKFAAESAKFAIYLGRGYFFSLDWLLRNATAVATGRSVFTSLETVSPQDFSSALDRSARYVSNFLDAVSGRLGLDHDRVLMGRGAIPVVSRLLHLTGGRFTDARQRDRALFWYIHAGLWGRFASATETTLAQDYEVLGEPVSMGSSAALRGGVAASTSDRMILRVLAGAHVSTPCSICLPASREPEMWVAACNCVPRCSDT